MCLEVSKAADRWDELRALQEKYKDLKPWEMPQEYWDGLNRFCERSKKFVAESQKEIKRPSNPHAGEQKRGTTEFDVFNRLSLNRLKKNGIHG